MKLFNVPRNSRIKLLASIDENGVPPEAQRLQKGRVLHFHNTDGMFSRCTTLQGETVHLSAIAEVQVVETA